MSELHDDTPVETGWYWVLIGESWLMAFLDTRNCEDQLRVLSNGVDSKFDGVFCEHLNGRWIDDLTSIGIPDPLVWYGPLVHPERL